MTVAIDTFLGGDTTSISVHKLLDIYIVWFNTRSLYRGLLLIT